MLAGIAKPHPISAGLCPTVDEGQHGQVLQRGEAAAKGHPCQFGDPNPYPCRASSQDIVFSEKRMTLLFKCLISPAAQLQAERQQTKAWLSCKFARFAHLDVSGKGRLGVLLPAQRSSEPRWNWKVRWGGWGEEGWVFIGDRMLLRLRSRAPGFQDLTKSFKSVGSATQSLDFCSKFAGLTARHLLFSRRTRWTYLHASMPLCVSCHSFVRFMFPRSHVPLVLGSFAWLLRDLLSDGRSRWRPPRNWKFIREAVIELVTRRLWLGNLAFRRVSASSLSGSRQHRI